MATSESGVKGRIRAESFADHYSQARMFYRSQTRHEQAHIASALVFELSKVQALPVREAMVGHLIHIDDDLAQRVAAGLALEAMPSAPQPAVAVKDLAVSPALQIIGKMKDTLEGRCVGILINDGSDGKTIAAIKKAVLGAGATVKIVSPKVGGAKLADGSVLPADGQLAGTPSVIFDAVAVVLSESGAQMLFGEAAAIDFIRDAFGHLKAIAIDKGGQALLQRSGVVPDAGVIDASEIDLFIAMSKTRQWAREPSIRTLP
jgi:catalase